MPKSRNILGDLERAVIEHLWAVKHTGAGVTVREVHDAVGIDRGLAYTTLMTVLDRMTKKGLVSRQRDGRAWRYTATSSREALTAETMHQTLGELAGDERSGALLHFLGSSTPEEVDELRSALAELEHRQQSAEASSRRFSRADRSA